MGDGAVNTPPSVFCLFFSILALLNPRDCHINLQKQRLYHKVLRQADEVAGGVLVGLRVEADSTVGVVERGERVLVGDRPVLL